MSWALIPLTEEQREIQRTARDFGARRDRAVLRRVGSCRSVRRGIAAKLGALGFLGMLIPEEYDGLGLDTCTYLVALEEIAAVDASVAVLMSVHNSLPTQMILRYGNDAQKERFLKPMARGEWLGAFALSEPEAGSDAAVAAHAGDRATATAGCSTARRRGSRAAITPTSFWPWRGPTRPSDRRGPRGIGTFIVTPDMPGFHVGKKEVEARPPCVADRAAALRQHARARRESARRSAHGLRLCHAVARQRPPRHRRAGGRHRTRPRSSTRRVMRPSAGSSISRSRSSRRFSSSSPTWRRA